MVILPPPRNNSPQWRKYIKNVIDAGIEVIDMYPIFMKHRSENNLFSKEHHISTFGAKITGMAISDYIKKTTISLNNDFNLLSEPILIYSSDYGNPELLSEKCDKFYLMNGIQKVNYWNQETQSSKIAIFGDCNLQSYSSHGAGIGANLAYFLRYPVYNAGRILLFGFEAERLSREDIMKLCRYDMIIYVAFASAPFVRTASIHISRPKFEYKWQHFNLK